MNKKYLIIGGVVLGLGAFAMAFLKRPKGTIIINPDGSGTAKLGNRTGAFEKGECVSLTTWNQWNLDACSDYMSLERFGTTYQEGGITEYFLGTSDVEIIHNK